MAHSSRTFDNEVSLLASPTSSPTPSFITSLNDMTQKRRRSAQLDCDIPSPPNTSVKRGKQTHEPNNDTIEPYLGTSIPMVEAVTRRMSESAMFNDTTRPPFMARHAKLTTTDKSREWRTSDIRHQRNESGRTLAKFGWPCADPQEEANDVDIGHGFGIENNDEDDEEDEEDFINMPFRRSIYNDLINSSEFGHLNGDDDMEPYARRQGRSFVESLSACDPDAPSDTVPMRGMPSGDTHSIPFAPEDEVDLFFSSHADDPHPDPMLSSSISRAEILSSAMRTSGYLTSSAHFLTAEYFESHDPDDRDLFSDNDQDDSDVQYLEAHFSIESRLGSGEFATVSKVKCKDTGVYFAVKKTKTPFCGYDDRWQQILEADHLLAVRGSRHCVNLANAWEQDGHLYLQMELCDCGSLETFLSYKAADVIEESLMWNIIYDIASGINDIHQGNIVHLDLKPSNILIDAQGYLKIADFGLSVQWPVDPRYIKGEGDRRYMAPDLLREQFDKPADIFSLGLIALEMMTKTKLPETGESWEMLRLGDLTDYPPASQHLSALMQQFVRSMLIPEPQNRPSIEALLEHPELQRIHSERKLNQHGPLYEYAQLYNQLHENT
ncbi:kinase-like domain-containing protein [Radiomyces spectabilis]|uniref:kinase-like domain-containing protein n=1 Tax=Radiomyces spectabilis TaxID=64574 RepID=UPI0022210BC0|nr:kinase-like domain-containing protein [Radiomyces spectabilis]KAI8384959.1 kinase-like domain-containing protein [Radiomyces spectabilis]